MARGWESKAVESQIEEAAKGSAGTQDPLNLAPVELRQQRETLLLARVRVLQDLKAARHPRHRRILQDALDHLERELAKKMP